jgi:hypothetical protein
MKANEVKRVLVSHDVSELFHANSVITALTFINHGGLISRGTVEDCGLHQTLQESDEIDKVYGIYNDIFFDSVDIHKRAKKLNDYGAITFVYSIDVLDELEDYEICVTRDNPIRWKESMTNNERYFTDYNDLDSNFVKGNFVQHITVKDIRKALSFNHLKEIIIDYPGESREKYFIPAYDALEIAIKNNKINVPISKRECSSECQCQNQYSNNKEGFTYYRFKTK